MGKDTLKNALVRIVNRKLCYDGLNKKFGLHMIA